MVRTKNRHNALSMMYDVITGGGWAHRYFKMTDLRWICVKQQRNAV